LSQRGRAGPNGPYGERTHPDLEEWLGRLAEGLDARLDSRFGVPVLVSGNGVIFAYAVGMSVIFFREPPAGFSQELPSWEHDRSDALPGWVATDAWLGSRMDWKVREGDTAVRERCSDAAAGAREPATPAG
jgi:hypothetical protein